MANFEVEYSYSDKLYGNVNLHADTIDDVPAQFEKYVKDAYLLDLTEEEQPTDFFIEGVMELKNGE